MKSRQMLDLRCPFCAATALRLTQVIYWPGSLDVRFGLLRCDCDVFPIVEGIVVMRRNQQLVVEELLRAYRTRTTPDMLLVLQQLSEFRLIERRVFVVLVRITSSIKKLMPRFHQSHALLWWKLGLTVMSVLSTNHFLRLVFSYFRDRDQRPTYCLVASVLPLLKTARVVVEVGGGAGHFVRELSQELPSSALYSLEKNFWLVYWLVCNGLYRSNVCPIVINFEGGLPLKNSLADAVMANDTIMYVNHQHRLATEMRRVMKKSGWCIGMHIHQHGKKNIAQGNGVNPRELMKWLGLPYSVTWSDRSLFQQLWTKKKLEFKTKPNQKVISVGDNSYSFIASNRQKMGALHLRSRYLRNQLNYVEDQW